MTGDSKRLAAVLVATGAVLLDFDGPVCGVYAGGLNLRASGQLRDQLHSAGVEIPAHLNQERDPLAVLRYVDTLGRPDLTDQIERALTVIEIDAVNTAPQTAGSSAFIQACNETHRPIVVVSNNAAAAIHAYLDQHKLTALVRGVVGRPHAEPNHMKPAPRPIQSALNLLDMPPHRCVLVGDSTTDIEVSHSTGLRSIAYVKTADRREKLSQTRPDALVDSMSVLADAIRNAGPTL